MPIDLATLSGGAVWLKGNSNGIGGSDVNTWVDQLGLHNAVMGTGGFVPPKVVADATPLKSKSVKFTGNSRLHLGPVLTAPVGFIAPVATASSNYGGEEPINAINGSPASWTTDGSAVPQWWQVVFDVAKKITTYSIQSRDDILSRNPNTWTLQGSNDAFATNDVLDTRTGITWDTTGLIKTYTFANTVAYLAYRIVITANNGDGYCSLNELIFGETVLGDIEMAPHGYEAWVVVKSQIIYNQANPMWKWSNVATYTGYPTATGTTYYIYESFCTNSYNYTYRYSTDKQINVWRVYRVTFDGYTLKTYLDGDLVANQGGFGTDLATDVLLGGGSYGGTIYPFYGEIAELYARNKVSSPDTALKILKYLQAEHIYATVYGHAPVTSKTRYPYGVVPEITGDAPVTSASSLNFAIQASTVSGMAPVDVKSESLFVAELSGYPGESNEILVPIELSGLIDPLFPPPIPPVDFAGLVDPFVAPTLTKSDTAGGHLLVGTYRYSYAAWKGTPAQATAPSPWATITLVAEDTVTLTYPTIAGADGYLVYREEL